MRAMRLLVLFDLPTGSAAQRRSYSEFRKFLIQDGYRMEQFSVYSRIVIGRDTLDKHVARLKDSLPTAGSVTVFVFTEKQYQNRMLLLRKSEEGNGSNDLGTQLTIVL